MMVRKMMSAREINEAVFVVMERNERLTAIIDKLQKRIENVEMGQSFLSRRDPPNPLPFPKVLRLYGLLPPEERTAT